MGCRCNRSDNWYRFYNILYNKLECEYIYKLRLNKIINYTI